VYLRPLLMEAIDHCIPAIALWGTPSQNLGPGPTWGKNGGVKAAIATGGSQLEKQPCPRERASSLPDLNGSPAKAGAA
jgi:hypothetical protein